jgi:hypothetical protein
MASGWPRDVRVATPVAWAPAVGALPLHPGRAAVVWPVPLRTPDVDHRLTVDQARARDVAPPSLKPSGMCRQTPRREFHARVARHCDSPHPSGFGDRRRRRRGDSGAATGRARETRWSADGGPVVDGRGRVGPLARPVWRPRYSAAFACSLLLYPQPHRRALRCTYPEEGLGAYPVPLPCPSGAGLPFPPVAVLTATREAVLPCPWLHRCWSKPVST